MRLNLKDGRQFVTYLKALNPSLISDSQKVGLKEIADVLTQQFTGSYDFTDAESEPLMELMGNLSKIIEEYKRLDKGEEILTKSMSSLERYLSLARKGILREYREAEKLKLHKPFIKEDFTLRWHIDASPELLRDEWNRVLAVLQTISQNEKAKKIYEQALRTANDALEAAISDVTEWQEGGEDSYRSTRKREFLSILQSTKVKLADF